MGTTRLGCVAVGLAMLLACAPGSVKDPTVGTGDDTPPEGGFDAAALAFGEVFPVSGTQVEPPIQTAAAGQVEIQVNEDSGELTARLTLSNVAERILWVSIRQGYFGGPESVDVVELLERDGVYVSPSGATLDEDQLQAWGEGRMFVQVVDTDLGEPLLRGQVGSPASRIYQGVLTPDQVNIEPPLDTGGMARLYVTANTDLQRLNVALQVDETEILAVAAYVQVGSVDVNDPFQPYIDLYKLPEADGLFVATSFSADGIIFDALERNQLYAVVYSATNGVKTVHGALRGVPVPVERWEPEP